MRKSIFILSTRKYVIKDWNHLRNKQKKTNFFFVRKIECSELLRVVPKPSILQFRRWNVFQSFPSQLRHRVPLLLEPEQSSDRGEEREKRRRDPPFSPSLGHDGAAEEPECAEEEKEREKDGIFSLPTCFSHFHGRLPSTSLSPALSFLYPLFSQSEIKRRHSSRARITSIRPSSIYSSYLTKPPFHLHLPLQIKFQPFIYSFSALEILGIRPSAKWSQFRQSDQYFKSQLLNFTIFVCYETLLFLVFSFLFCFHTWCCFCSIIGCIRYRSDEIMQY